MLTVTNELTGETFETESLRKAQAYRDAHEDGVVAIHNGVVLIGESSGRFMLRKSAAGRTVRQPAKSVNLAATSLVAIRN